MIIQKPKNHTKILSFISLTIVAIFFCAVNVYADDYNGSGTSSVGCKGQSSCYCNQDSSQLCIWDVKNHVILEVSLYYFPSKTGLSGGVKIGDSQIYANGNIAYYTGMGFFSGKTIYSLPGFPTSTRGGISAPAKTFFYDTISNFRQLFKNITGVSLASDDANNTLLKKWMEEYCQTQGYGSALSACHQATGGSKGFRIVIQPILTGLYGSSDSVRVGTVKDIFGRYDVWNLTDTKIGVSTAMYLNKLDIGFSVGQTSSFAGSSTVASDTSGYGLNMFTWPVDVTVSGPCDPATDGVKYCCDLYDIEYSTDAPNRDSTKIKTPMTQTQLNNAGCHKVVVDDCTTEYKFAKTVPSTCANGVSGLVSDSASWKCVFTSTKSSRDTTVRNNYLFSSFSNRYCSIYCEEKIEYQLPGTGAYAYAGTYFTITTISGYQKIGPITYKGTSTCRVTSQTSSDDGIIDVAQFVNEFKAADRAVLVAYDNWQYAELQNEVISNATSNPWSHSCTDSWPCKKTSTYTTKDLKGNITTHSYCAEEYTCSESRSGTYYTYSNKYYSGATFSRSTGISNGSCGCTSRCGSSCTPKQGLKNVAALKAAYESAINYRTSLLEELKKCNNFYKTYKEFKPNVTFTYDDVLYKNTYTLKATGTASSSTEYFSSGTSKGSKNTSTRTYSNSVSSDAANEINAYNTNSTSVRGYSSLINYYNCGHSVTKTGCSTINQYLYPTNAWYEQVTKRTYAYTLPDGKNNYVDKPSGFSSSTATANYDYIPFSNLPIHYSTKPGDYNYYITTTSYGINNKFNKYIIDGTANFNKVSYHTDTKYACTYKISSNKTVICVEGTTDSACSEDDGGTDLIYRTISLYYPFPGQNATATNLRTAGTNWLTASGSDAISKYIYNNRGVSYYELYKLQPMYEVTLTPALMKKIQEYNTDKNNTKEFYYRGTAKESHKIVGYSDFTLTCKTSSNGSKSGQCTSSVIRSWGVKGCAISGSGYTKCGNTVAW